MELRSLGQYSAFEVVRSLKTTATKHQGAMSSKNQGPPTTARPSGRILFAASPRAERHRPGPFDDHGERVIRTGGKEAHEAGFDRRGHRIAKLNEPLRGQSDDKTLWRLATPCT